MGSALGKKKTREKGMESRMGTNRQDMHDKCSILSFFPIHLMPH